MMGLFFSDSLDWHGGLTVLLVEGLVAPGGIAKCSVPVVET